MTPTKLTERQKAILDEFAKSGGRPPHLLPAGFLQKVREMFGDDHYRTPGDSHADSGAPHPTDRSNANNSDKSTTDASTFHPDSTEPPPLPALVHELRASLQASRDHLDDLTTLVDRLEALSRLPNHQGGNR